MRIHILLYGGYYDRAHVDLFEDLVFRCMLQFKKKCFKNVSVQQLLLGVYDTVNHCNSKRFHEVERRNNEIHNSTNP